MPPAPKPPPEPGTRFGRWTVISEAQYRVYGGKKHRFVKARCDCGKAGWVSVSRLRNGYSNSCGCLAKEKHTAFLQRNAPLPTTF